ncbi:dihydroorotate dehydrogenase electron transfer subunit [Natribacillus halophilus]|uniref:dihydroorotate dehydrogenase electron transfer subunit n=1 Tax=Natribacillus halophilus TaxID=549003 RepID=UPI000A4D9AE3|nr:dihydroorotate dehydrogenase electron transfer subunit [Natribacillus halophilus]
MKDQEVKILSNIQVSERYWHMVVDASGLASDVEPGQFFYIDCGQENESFLRRPFSVYRINQDDQTLEFLYLTKGLGTQALTKLKQGETVRSFGPLGQGFSLQEDAQKILLLARGVGIATLAALAQEASKKGVQCAAILSARSHNDLLAAEMLQGFGAEVHKVTEEDGTSDVENVRDIIEDITARHNIDAAYTCGSRRLSRLLQDITSKKDIPAEIALEEHMGCAMGVCYACVCDVVEDDEIRTVRVCLEGPVFPLQKVMMQP